MEIIALLERERDKLSKERNLSVKLSKQKDGETDKLSNSLNNPLRSFTTARTN